MSGFRKSTEMRALKLLVLHTVPGNSFTEDLVAEVVGAIKQQGQVEVANYDVASLKLHTCPGCKEDGSQAPCRVNDIDSEFYKADDQFLPIFDSLKQADMVLLSATARVGGINAAAQTLIERLECAFSRHDHAFKGKVLGVVVASTESDVWNVASRVIGYLNGFGFMVPPFGTLVLTSVNREEDDESTHDDESSSDETSEVVQDVLALRETQERITKLANSMVEAAKNGR